MTLLGKVLHCRSFGEASASVAVELNSPEECEAAFDAVNGFGVPKVISVNLRATALRLVGICPIIPGSSEAQGALGAVGALEGKVLDVPNETAYVPGGSPVRQELK